jgi:hypothetical protein
MNSLVKATLVVSIGASALMVAPQAKAVSYSVGGTVTSTPEPTVGQRRYRLQGVTMFEGGGAPASGDAATAFRNFVYTIIGGPVNTACNNAGKSCPLSFATPLTVPLTSTPTFGNSITFENPLVTRMNPLGSVGSNTFQGFGAFTTASGRTGTLSFTVNPSTTWGGTLDVSDVPGPLPAAGVIAGLSFARRMRRQLKATV